MNAYWIETKTITSRSRVYPGNWENPDVYMDEDWGAAAVVYAKTRSQARYIFWRDILQPDIKLFRDALDVFKTIRFIANAVWVIEPKCEHPQENSFYWQEECRHDYTRIQHPIWREVAIRFWDYPSMTDFEGNPV